jgi:hypothetical protein
MRTRVALALERVTLTFATRFALPLALAAHVREARAIAERGHPQEGCRNGSPTATLLDEERGAADDDSLGVAPCSPQQRAREHARLAGAGVECRREDHLATRSPRDERRSGQSRRDISTKELKP